jgi:hypothetical protein
MSYVWRRVSIVALSAICVISASASGPAQEQRAPASFENLFRSLEEDARSASSPAASLPTDGLASQVSRLIGARQAVVGGDGGLFKTINDALQQEATCRGSMAQLNQAIAQLNACQMRFAAEETTSARLGQDTLGLRGARNALENAQAIARRAQADVATQTNRLEGLYSRVRRDLPQFFAIYSQLRQLLPLEQGALNAEIASLVARPDRDCPLFVEGHVVAAIALIYDGRDAAAEESLEKANAVFSQCPSLVATALAEDCCAAWLLLGRPDKVAKFVAAIHRIHARHRSATQDWLLGDHAHARGRHEEAARLLGAAVNKARKSAPAALIADAALASLMTTPSGRRPVKALELLQRVEGDKSWQVLQCRAAVSAAEGRWHEAIELVLACEKKAPPCLAAELARQRSAYEREQMWRP